MKPSSSQSQNPVKYFATKSTVQQNFDLEDEQSISDETTELPDNEVCISLHPSNMYPAFLHAENSNQCMQCMRGILLLQSLCPKSL